MWENNTISRLRKVEHLVVKLEGVLLATTMFGLLAVISIQVLCRYCLHISTPWAEETARYLFVWMSYVGAGRAFSEMAHIEIDIMNTVIDSYAKKSSQKYRTILSKISLVSTAVFLIAFAGIFSQFLGNIAKLGQHSPSTGINMLLPMSGVFVGTILMIYHVLCRIVFPFEAASATNEK